MRSGNFVEERAVSIAGTGGNGAVTLGAVTGSPRFADVIGAAAATIRYVIEDTAAKKFEVGIGSVAAGVLTRLQVLQTWDGTTYRDMAPAPIAFGTMPTTVRVRLAATAATQGVPMPRIQTLLGPAEVWRDYPLSAHIVWSNNAGSAIAMAGRVHLYYKLERSGRLTGAQFEIMTAAAGASVAVALYNIGVDGLPDQQIVRFNDQPTTTAAVITDTASGTWSTGGPVFLEPGWYSICIAVLTTATTVGLRGFLNAAGTNVALPTPLGRFASYASYKSSLTVGVYGAPPLREELTAATVNHPLWAGLRIE